MRRDPSVRCGPVRLRTTRSGARLLLLRTRPAGYASTSSERGHASAEVAPISQSFNVRLHFDAPDHTSLADALLAVFRGEGPIVSTTKQGQVVLQAMIGAADPLDAIIKAQLIARRAVTAPVVAIEVVPAAESDMHGWGHDVDRGPAPWSAAGLEGRRPIK